MRGPMNVKNVKFYGLHTALDHTAVPTLNDRPNL